MENKLEIIIDALRHARDVIGMLDRPAGNLEYNGFETLELRNMYYDINDMCCRIAKMQEK